MIKLDGKALAEKIKLEIKNELIKIKNDYGKVPGLAIILVGENSASKVYVNSKIKGCESLGINSYVHLLNENITEIELLNLIENLNQDDRVNGILVQLPLPKHINEQKVIEKIEFLKDVDGFKPDNLGRLMLNDSEALVSCTPAGIMEIFKEYSIKLEGKDVVMIGRSNIVGKPMTSLLINSGATVTVCHSKTQELTNKIKNADIVIVAIGKPKFITKEMVKDNAVIVDVGINRTEIGLCGDVDYENVAEKCSYITPVPGGVGPMTVAILFKNTLKAFKKQNNIILK